MLVSGISYSALFRRMRYSRFWLQMAMEISVIQTDLVPSMYRCRKVDCLTTSRNNRSDMTSKVSITSAPVLKTYHRGEPGSNSVTNCTSIDKGYFSSCDCEKELSFLPDMIWEVFGYQTYGLHKLQEPCAAALLRGKSGRNCFRAELGNDVSKALILWPCFGLCWLLSCFISCVSLTSPRCFYCCGTHALASTACLTSFPVAYLDV